MHVRKLRLNIYSPYLSFLATAVLFNPHFLPYVTAVTSVSKTEQRPQPCHIVLCDTWTLWDTAVEFLRSAIVWRETSGFNVFFKMTWGKKKEKKRKLHQQWHCVCVCVTHHPGQRGDILWRRDRNDLLDPWLAKPCTLSCGHHSTREGSLLSIK